MEGAALAAKRRLDENLFTAWHTAVFALNGYGGKLKPLPKYLSDTDGPKSTAAQAVAFFHGLKAKGVPVKIYRTPRNELN